MSIVYSLSAKGVQACQSERSSLPAELRQLLHLVDGQRTRGELIGSLQKSALTAGGLRWLEASGYIRPAPPPPVARAPSPPPAPVARAPQPAAPAAARGEDRTDARALLRMALAQYMLNAVGHWLGEQGAPHRRLIESATRVEQLLQYLNPLTDAIVARAGAQAGAQFAEDAAAILER